MSDSPSKIEPLEPRQYMVAHPWKDPLTFIYTPTFRGSDIFRATYSPPASRPTPFTRANVNFGGVVSFGFTKADVSLNLFQTGSNGGAVTFTFTQALARRGKAGFAGNANALVTLDDGTLVGRIPIRVVGSVFRDSRGVAHVKGEFYAFSNGQRIVRGDNLAFAGKFFRAGNAK